MKKFLTLLFVSAVAITMIAISSCKKDDLQPNWWTELFHDTKEIMKSVDQTRLNNEVSIGNYRNTIGEVYWDDELITLNGPGSYSLLAAHATRMQVESYKSVLIPDTTGLCQEGELASIIKSYLEKRRDYPREKAFKKLFLKIPKSLYEQYPHFWERFLSELHKYLTEVIGGPDEWTTGERNREREMELYYLPIVSDPDDPWGYNCPASMHWHDYYLGIAQGPEKMAIANQETIQLQIEKSGNERYQRFLENVKMTEDISVFGAAEDFQTKYIDGYYVLGVPVIPLKEE